MSGNAAMVTHLHARYAHELPPALRERFMTTCPTVCGAPCDSGPVVYRDRDLDRVTCPVCLDSRES